MVPIKTTPCIQVPKYLVGLSVDSVEETSYMAYPASVV